MNYTKLFHSHGPEFIAAIRTLLAAAEKSNAEAFKALEMATLWGAEPGKEEQSHIDAANDAANAASAALHAAWRGAGLCDRPTWEIALAVTP